MYLFIFTNCPTFEHVRPDKVTGSNYANQRLSFVCLNAYSRLYVGR